MLTLHRQDDSNAFKSALSTFGVTWERKARETEKVPAQSNLGGSGNISGTALPPDSGKAHDVRTSWAFVVCGAWRRGAWGRIEKNSAEVFCGRVMVPRDSVYCRRFYAGVDQYAKSSAPVHPQCIP